MLKWFAKERREQLERVPKITFRVVAPNEYCGSMSKPRLKKLLSRNFAEVMQNSENFHRKVVNCAEFCKIVLESSGEVWGGVIGGCWNVVMTA